MAHLGTGVNNLTGGFETTGTVCMTATWSTPPKEFTTLTSASKLCFLQSMQPNRGAPLTHGTQHTVTSNLEPTLPLKDGTREMVTLPAKHVT